jgi:hypothetical protein
MTLHRKSELYIYNAQKVLIYIYIICTDRLHLCSIDMYNNDVGKRFMK